MKYNIFTIPPFDRQFKRLAKKHPSLKNDFTKLILQLELRPETGTALGNNCFKIRLSVSSKGKGKSGGARVISHLQITKQHIFLLTIYDKAERDSISNAELKELLKFIQ